MEAAKQNNSVGVRLLLKFGASLNLVDEKGRTALTDASDRSMQRLLLDAGANPDLGRVAGMTSMAFFASFRQRAMVDLFQSYGADTSERMRQGMTVQEALDDPGFAWHEDVLRDDPETKDKYTKHILRYSDNLHISPEQYVSHHRNILIWSLHTETYTDPRLGAWATRVSEILASPILLEQAYRQNLEGEALEAALRSLERPKRREERERLRRERDAEFEALHLKPSSPD